MSRLKIILSIAFFIAVSLGAALFYIVSMKNPDDGIAKHIPLPIACNVYGCVTTIDWGMQRSYDIAFAQQTGKELPSEAATLTTAIRRHLITHASLASPISPQDAVRYRTAILHTTDIASLKPLGVSSFTTYDTAIILPFLQQEAFMKQHSITDTNALYQQLAHQHPLLFLLFYYHWNTDRGEVEY